MFKGYRIWVFFIYLFIFGHTHSHDLNVFRLCFRRVFTFLHHYNLHHRGTLPLRELHSTDEIRMWRDPGGSWTCLRPVSDYDWIHPGRVCDWLIDWSLILKDKDFRQKPSLTICPCLSYNTHVYAKYSGVAKWQKMKEKAWSCLKNSPCYS